MQILRGSAGISKSSFAGSEKLFFPACAVSLPGHWNGTCQKFCVRGQNCVVNLSRS